MTQRRVRAFLELIDRYAFLERLIQGEIAYELPVHSAVLDDAPVDSPEQAGLLLARAELALQEDTEYPGIDLHEHLDGQGIKIVTVGETGRSPGSGPASETPPAAAPHAAAQMPAGPIEAVFFFEGATGPAFLAGAPKESFLGNFTLAHLYAHLIADVDPYRSRVCRWAPDTL